MISSWGGFVWSRLLPTDERVVPVKIMAREWSCPMSVMIATIALVQLRDSTERAKQRVSN